MKKPDLSGLNVLVTRPEPQATELATMLQQQGAKAFVWPCLQVLPISQPESIRAIVHALHRKDIGIFVSPNAVLYTFKALSEFEKVHLQQLCLVAVGKSTAEALKHHGCQHIYFPGTANSEAVLELAILQDVIDKPIYIFRAQSGRELIAETLSQRGALIRYVETYRREKSTQAVAPLFQAWQTQPFDIVVSASTESLEHLFDQTASLPQGLWKHTTLTVMNEKMLHLATKHGIQRTITLESAGNEAILTCLKRFWHERQ